MSPARSLRAADRRLPRWKIALILALVSTVLKDALLLFPSAHVSPAWVLPEEQHRGNIARELIDGPLLPLQDYQHAPNVGGSVVVGSMAVPFVAVLGDSIAAVRAVPILFNALSVVLLVLLLDRFASRRAAWIGGLLFALAPPGYSLLAITAFGTHVENNAFTLLAVLLFLHLHRIGTADPSRGKGTQQSGEARTALALGVVSGFALYFGYFFGVALVTMLVYEHLHDKLFWLRRWFRFALLGFVAGFAPWISYNLAAHFRGLSIYGEPITQRVSIANLFAGGAHRLALFFSDQLPSSFFFRGLAPGLREPAQWTAALLMLGGVAWLAWQAREKWLQAAHALVSLRARPHDLGAPFLFALYVPVYIAFFMATDVDVGPVASRIAHDGRYCAPLYPFLCLIAACALDGAGEHGLGENGPARSSGEHGARRFVARWLPAAAAALFVIGTLAVCDPSRAGEALRTPGSSPEQLARWMAWTWRTDERRLERVVDGVQTRRPPEIADGMIFTLAQGLKWGMRMQDTSTRKGHAAFRDNVVALHFLHDRVADAYKPYCEMPVAGEPLYTYRERDKFWTSYRHRERAARVRNALALATP